MAWQFPVLIQMDKINNNNIFIKSTAKYIFFEKVECVKFNDLFMPVAKLWLIKLKALIIIVWKQNTYIF